jgi:hypothetical protein
VTLSYVGHNVAAFPQIPRTTAILKLDISDNPLTAFVGMQSYRSLMSVVANRTKITSFKGVKPQDGVQQIMFYQTPLGCEPHFPLMALVVFGSSLNIINGRVVTDTDHALADGLRPQVLKLLADGWLLKRIVPVTLLNPVTRRRRVAYGIAVPPPVRTRVRDIQVEEEVFEDVTLGPDPDIETPSSPRRHRRVATRELRTTPRHRLMERAHLATVGTFIRSPTDEKRRSRRQAVSPSRKTQPAALKQDVANGEEPAPPADKEKKEADE